MTIIKYPRSLGIYPYKVLPHALVDQISRGLAGVPGRNALCTPTVLKLFEAYCDIAGHKITYKSPSSPRFLRIAKGFLGALSDRSFVAASGSARYAYIAGFLLILDELRKVAPNTPTFSSEERLSIENMQIWEDERSTLSPGAILYWSGWIVNGRLGKTSYAPIPLIWNSHGATFAEETYQAYQQYSKTKLAPNHSEFYLFLTYLSQNAKLWPCSTFRNPVKLKQLFIEFMLYSFKKTHDSGSDINIKTRSYSKFAYTMDEAFIQSGLWVTPFSGSIPRPVSKAPPGTHTHIRKKSDGSLEKVKLVTTVPLSLTETEAIEILFKNIKSDIRLVLSWAKEKLHTIRILELKRNRLAREGRPITSGNSCKNSLSEIGEHNVCATFAESGLSYIRKNPERVIGTASRASVSNLLALPTTEHFLALQLLLVHEHPCFNESSLKYLELYDKRGNETGFKSTDAGYQLTAYKDRKGGRLSEITVILSPRLAAYVRRVISLTQALREELRKAGDDNWRKLFLHCTGYIGLPKQAEPMKINRTTIRYLQETVNEFSALSGKDSESTEDFLCRLSVTAFRASSAVEVYLDTHSAEEMAKALGHTAYNAGLLRSYLPEPILDFIQTRWIRVFQRGLICEAMKGSPRLLDATKFESMAEFHLFMENHALRSIPEHLQNPDQLIQPGKGRNTVHRYTQTADRLIVPIEQGVLIALVSLKEAVSLAKEKSRINAKSIYWSKFTELVINEIESGYNNELHQYLNIARQSIDAASMENLIYEVTE
ncbi:hypothetical protein KXR72_15550 [Stutzerimonas chloritidismutans]